MAAQSHLEILITATNQAKKIVDDLVRDLGKVADTLQKTGEQGEETAEQIQSVAPASKGTGDAINNLATVVGTFTNRINSAFHAIKILTGGFLAFKVLAAPVHFAQAAGEAEQLARGLEIVGNTSGYATEALKETVHQLEALGVSSSLAQNQLTKLLTSQVELGTATQLGESSKLLADAFGKSINQTFQQVAVSISRGTTLLLARQFGIAINEQQVFFKRSQELGRELFQDERREALARALNERIQAQFGGSGQAFDSLSAKQDALSSSSERLRETIGDLLLPAFKGMLDVATGLVKGFTFLIESFSHSATAADRNYKATGLLADLFRSLRDLLASVVKFVKDYSDALLVAAAAAGVFTAAHILMTTNFALLAASLISAVPLLGLFSSSALKATVALDVLTKGLIALRTATLVLAPVLALLTVALVAVTKTDFGIDFFRQIIVAIEELGSFLARAAELVRVPAQLFWDLITGNFSRAKERLAEAKANVKALAEDTVKALERINKAKAEQVKQSEGPAAFLEEGFDDPDGKKAAAAREEVKRKETDRLLEIRKRQNAIQLEFDKRAAESHKTSADAVRNINAQAEAEDKARLDRAQLTLEEYFSRRAARFEEDAANERALAQRRIEDARSAEARVLQEKTRGSPEHEQAVTAVKAAQEELTRITQAQATNRLNLGIEGENQLLQIRRARTEEGLRFELEADSESLKARLAQIDLEFDKKAESLRAVAGSQAAIDLDRARQQARYLAALELEAKVKERNLQLATAQIDLERSAIAVLARQGQLTDVERLNLENDLIRRQIDLQKDQLRDKVKLASSGPTPEIRRKAAQEALAIEAEINRLTTSVETMGDRIRGGFTDALATAFDNLIQRTTTLREALRNLGLDVVRLLSGAVSRLLAQEAVKVLVEVTGGVGNSIFDQIGKIFGDKGTPTNPMYVAMAPGFNLTQSASPGITGLFEGLFGLTGDATPLASAAAASGIISPFASGGRIRGPSHSAGGVLINAEGGEYVVNKRAASRWGSLLHAINMGGLDTLRGPSMRPRGVYADGGVVSDGVSTSNSKTEVNIAIHETGAVVGGNSDNAVQLGRNISGLVQAEIVKQKRPGGLLHKK